jgi:hypothetical protein
VISPVVAFAALGLFGGILAFARPGAEPAPAVRALPGERAGFPGSVFVPGTRVELDALVVTACGCVASQPEANAETIAACVWVSRADWAAVPWPPIPTDHASVLEAAALVRAAVHAALHENGCKHDDARALPLPLPPARVDDTDTLADVIDVIEIVEEDDDDDAAADIVDDEPREPAVEELPDISAIASTKPACGIFYLNFDGVIPLGDHGFVAQALYDEAFNAAKEAGRSTLDAQQIAAAIAADPSNRLAYWRAVQCGRWNDAMWGTWGYGPGAVPGPHGRAIRILPYHDDAYGRLDLHEPPIRTIKLGSYKTRGDGKGWGSGSNYELLWLPPLRRDALLDPKRKHPIVAEGLYWPDGSSKMDPPPWVQELGIVDLPPAEWGCHG